MLREVGGGCLAAQVPESVEADPGTEPPAELRFGVVRHARGRARDEADEVRIRGGACGGKSFGRIHNVRAYHLTAPP